jgi:hypothetical protein
MAGLKMDHRIVISLIADKLKDRGTYILALMVGTLINAYGQLLVPWFRNGNDPFSAFSEELAQRPELTLISVFLGYAFPFFVGTFSAVATRYKNRRTESIADFPDRKPDPVFRATRQGEFVEVGAETQRLFTKYRITKAQMIIGSEEWSRLCDGDAPASGVRIHYAKERADYLVNSVQTTKGLFNVYMTRIPVALMSQSTE